jgi:hypothetical protein
MHESISNLENLLANHVWIEYKTAWLLILKKSIISFRKFIRRILFMTWKTDFMDLSKPLQKRCFNDKDFKNNRWLPSKSFPSMDVALQASNYSENIRFFGKYCIFNSWHGRGVMYLIVGKFKIFFRQLRLVNSELRRCWLPEIRPARCLGNAEVLKQGIRPVINSRPQVNLEKTV